jgi:tetratricopeptide (TPR) repeat protein
MRAGGVAGQEIRDALERVLSSAGFVNNQRLSAFLRFTIERHLEGRHSELKESVIAVEVFGRRPDYDPKQDAIVRTEAVRLRARLEKYYATEGSGDTLVIELPKGGYIPLFRTGKAPEPASPPPPGMKRHRLAAAFSFFVLVLGVLALFLHFEQSPALIARDTILLADFVNTTGDAAFDGTLKQGLAVQLEQSPYLTILADERIRETLRLMGRSPGERITNEVGREIGQRQGAKALIEASIVALGGHYVITLEAVNAASGEAIARMQVEAEGKERVLHTLGGAATQLRRKLGESLPSIRKYDVPLEQATTSSLEALKALSLGRQKNRAGDYREAIRWFHRAVDLDPNFALAFRGLSANYCNIGETGPCVEALRKAFELRGRASEVERLSIESGYYFQVTGEVDRAIEALETVTRIYPQWYGGWNNLGEYYKNAGQYEKSIAPLREVVRLVPNATATSNLAHSLIALNRLAEAKEVCAKAAERRMDSSNCHWALYEAAFLNGEDAEVQRQLAWANAHPDPATALMWQAATGGFKGQSRKAREFARRLMEVRLSRNGKDSAATAAAFLASIEGFLSQCRQAGDDGMRALELGRGQPALTFVLFASAQCGDADRTQAIAGELAKLYPGDVRLNRTLLPALRTLLDIRRSHTTTAVQELAATDPYGGDVGLDLRYCRGEIYLKRRRAAEAAAEFQGILDRRGWAPLSPVYPLAHLGLARAAALTGDLAKSRRVYQDFFALWKDADPDLPVLLEAKREYEEVRSRD